MALIDEYSNEEFNRIVKISNSWRDLAKNLGYKSNSGDLKDRLQKKVDELNLNTSHFNHIKPMQRNEDNIFIKNSTANQSTLRKWYLKGNYSEYKCSICGQEPFWNGKELTLILDHINGINNDDRLENLHWVCPNCNQQLDTTNGKNPNRKNHAKKYYCIDCGKEISYGSERCQECNSKYHTIPIEEMVITREELKQLIRIMPFTRIGEKYKVSDNTIRKWCEKLNLPKKSSIIKQYTDEEWSKI